MLSNVLSRTARTLLSIGKKAVVPTTPKFQFSSAVAATLRPPFIMGGGFTSSSYTKDRSQDIVVFFGAPGVGKGTFARLMAEDYGYTKISPGDEIRKILKGKTDSNLHPQIIDEVQSRVAEGKLIDDNLVIRILHQRLNSREHEEPTKGIILDGFPRTRSQLDWITHEFPESMFVNMELKTEVLIEGLLGRRTCIDCGTTYNVQSYDKDGYRIDAIVPEFEGICDNCGGEVILRDDDNLPSIMNRLKVYEEETMPLLKKCRTKPSFMNFEAKRGIYDYEKFKAIFEKEVKKNKPRKHYFMSSASLGENLILSLAF
jgi:adenylate kinase